MLPAVDVVDIFAEFAIIKNNECVSLYIVLEINFNILRYLKHGAP